MIFVFFYNIISIVNLCNKIGGNFFKMSELVLLFILILANAYFAAAEIAFISLNDAKLDLQVKEGNKKAKSIKKIL